MRTLVRVRWGLNPLRDDIGTTAAFEIVRGPIDPATHDGPRVTERRRLEDTLNSPSRYEPLCLIDKSGGTTRAIIYVLRENGVPKTLAPRTLYNIYLNSDEQNKKKKIVFFCIRFRYNKCAF